MDRSSIKGLLVSVYFISFNLPQHHFRSIVFDFVSFMYLLYRSFFFLFSSLLFFFYYEKKNTHTHYTFVPFSLWIVKEEKKRTLNKWEDVMSMACHWNEYDGEQGLMRIHRSSKCCKAMERPQAWQVKNVLLHYTIP